MKLNSIKNFAFNFDSCVNFTNEGVKKLSEGFKNLSALENVAINLDGCGQVDDEGLNELRQSFKRSSSIRKLRILSCQ